MNRAVLLQRTITRRLRKIRFGSVALVAAAFMWSTQAQAQTGDSGQPIPQRAFIANGGGDFGENADNAVKDSDRAYGVFFANMKQWGRYEIVSTPARAV